MRTEEIKSLCGKYGINPSKKFGQNFLIDSRITQIVANAANLDRDDCVVEVGPGLGELTAELAKKVKKVVAVEVDDRMYQAAKDLLAPYKNVELVHEDILEISNERLVETFYNPSLPPLTLRGGETAIPPLKVRGGEGGVMKPYKLVANLPYSITSAVLRKFTEPAQIFATQKFQSGKEENLGGQNMPSLIVVMVQKEVAQRVCAKPGEMSILSVAVQYYGKPEIVKIVPRSAFWPQPEVDSAVLKIQVSTASAGQAGFRGQGSGVDDKQFFKVVRAGFANRRKQLQNNLATGFNISKEDAQKRLVKAGLSPKIRPQELTVEQWIALSCAL